MIAGVLITLATLILFPFVLYPAVIRLFPRRPFAPPRLDEANLPRVAVLIPAYNEGEYIQEKLRDTLALDWPSDRLEVVVCDDGSTDDTRALAQAFVDRGIEVIANARNVGKASTLDHLRSATQAPLLLFTDASAELEPDVVRKLASALADPKVGVACARYAVRKNSAGDASETGYWDFEARVRKAEAERDLLLGASGAAYMVRAEHVEPLPTDTVNDDYVVPLRVRALGLRVAYVHDAVARDDATRDAATLYNRWRRIAFGNYQMLWRDKRLFFAGRVALPLLRKLLRTMLPLLLIAFVVTLLFAPAPLLELFGLIALGGIIVGALSAVIPDAGIGRNRAIQALRFVTLSQLAYLVGAGRFLAGRLGPWRHEPPPLDFDRPAPVPLRVRVLKRSFDVAFATSALLLGSPLMILLAVLVRLDSPGNVFYVQPRLCPGPGGRPIEFRMYKFRSMREGAERQTGPIWAGKNDDRVTRLGRFMRKHRLDELPQFINILKGEMSLVGPRPERRFYVDQFEEQIPGYNDRHMVLRPGITGWAQVQVGYDASTESVRDKLAHDLAYVAHLYHVRTYVKMELRILVRTVRVVLTGHGAR